MSGAAVDTAARLAGADSVHCEQSHADPRLTECRASLPNADAGRTVDLWLSSVNDTTSILTLSAPLSASRLDRWREYLEGRYGTPSLRVRGAITMAQWIHDRRMLRLTWRARGRNFEASVSMVDGRVLDAWGSGRVRSEK
jgi:hypothetical protein